MRALHTDILVDYLVAGNGKESKRADDFFNSAPDSEIYFVNNLILNEMTTYFEQNVKFDKSDTLTALQALLIHPQIQFENRDVIKEAVEAYQNSKSDFSDCLKNSVDRNFHCVEVRTQKEPGRLKVSI